MNLTLSITGFVREHHIKLQEEGKTRAALDRLKSGLADGALEALLTATVVSYTHG